MPKAITSGPGTPVEVTGPVTEIVTLVVVLDEVVTIVPEELVTVFVV
jgi:hypothetical protein